MKILACGVLLIGAATCSAEDWPMFRGPNGAGVATTSLPKNLNLEDHLVWKRPVPKGYSSPVIFKGRIFLTAETAGKLVTLCLDQKTGNEIWRVPAPRDRKEKVDQRNHPAAASAAVNADSVVVFFGDYGLVCYSHDGELRWKLPLGPFNNLYGMGASPIIVDGKAILVCDQQTGSFVVGVDLTTAQIAWKTERPSATSGHCTPILHEPGDGGPTQIIVAGSFYLTAYSAATGDKIWWVSGLSFEMKSTPVVADGLLFINGYASPYNQPDKTVKVDSFADVVATRDGNANGLLEKDEMPDQLAISFFDFIDLDGNKRLNQKEWRYFQTSMASKNNMMAMTLGGKGDVTAQNSRWRYHKNIPQLPSPVVINGRLYMISDAGIVTNFVAKTGQVNSRGRLAGASGSVYASPVIAGNQILFLTTRGTLAFVGVGDEIEVSNLIKFDEPCFATPAVSGSRLYVRTNKTLFCVGR